MANVVLKLFTHEPGPGHSILSKPVTLTVTESEAQSVVSAWYGGDGHTSVHEDTLRRFPVVG